MPSQRAARLPACASHRALVAALVCATLIAAAGGPATAATAPTTQPPDVRFVVGHALGTVTVPVHVAWPAAAVGSAAIARYYLQQRVDGGSWTSVSLSSALSRNVTVRLRPFTLNQFRVRARDTAGNYGAWSAGQPLWLSVIQDDAQQLETTGAWERRAPDSAYGGTLVMTEQPGATIGTDFVATRLAWVSREGPGRGRADVVVDGAHAATVDLLESTAQARRIVFAGGWSNAVAREVSIAAEGTAGRPRVEVDAFLTLGPPPTAVLVGAGDIATCPGSADEATARIVEQQPGIVFTTGDNVYPNGTASEYANCFAPSWGRFRQRIRPSPGNHDYNAGPTAAPYYQYFARNAGPAGRGWYAYDAGTWRIYALNSNCSQAGGCGATSAQYKWLAADLASNPRRCVAAYWHHPRFSSGRHGGSTLMRDMVELLYQRGADVVLAGHDHSYERFAPITPANVRDPARGIRHFIVGTGGAPLYAPGTNRAANSEVFESGSHGVLRLTLRWSAYDWQFVPVAGRTFTDSGTGFCH